MTVFLTTTGGVELAPPPYASADEYLDDLLGFAEHALRRGCLALAGRDAAAAAAQVSERRQWISDRAAATPHTVELPLEQITSALGLDPIDGEVIALCVAVDTDPRRLALLADLDGAAPPALTLAALHAALAPEQSRVAWLRARSEGVLASGVLIRIDDPTPQAALGAAPLRLNRSVLGVMLGAAVREPILDAFASRPRSALAWSERPEHARLISAVTSGFARGLVLWLSGGSEDAIELAAAIAGAARRTLVEIDVAALTRETRWGRVQALAALRIDQLLHRWIGLCDLRDVPAGLAAELRALDEAIAGPLIAVTDGDVPGLASIASRAVRHELARPAATERHELWTRALHAAGASLPEQSVHDLAEGFPMAAGEIRDVVGAALRMSGGQPPGADAFRAACLARQHSRLGRLADLVPPAFSWNDLVLPPDELDRLREIVDRQRHRHTVLTRWNLSAKLPYGTGTAALFAGPPGTGKTMAASVLASTVGRELYRVDLSRIVDKYIGETEKNLGRIFDAAADADAILLFDEADSLFGKRTQVQGSHDRYANLETNYLLQRIEQHPGISILTTNHVQNVDEAFARRIPFRVDFPFPDAAARAEIWRMCFPAELPARPIDFVWLGGAFELSGGHIKSAVVRAAFMAASANRPVDLELLTQAAQRELEAMGKLAPTTRPLRR